MSRRVRSRLLGFAATLMTWLLAASPAFAQTAVPPAVLEFEDAEIFRPTTDPGDFITVYDSDTLPRLRFHLGIYGDYARQPLEVQFERSGTLFAHLVNHLGTAQLSAAIGLLDWLEVGIRLPGYIESLEDVNVGGSSQGGTSGHFGDIVANAKFRLLDRYEHGFGIAILPEITFPTGDRESFSGTGDFGYGGLLIFDFAPTDQFRMGLNVGGVIRDKPGGGPHTDPNDDFNDQLRYGTGAAYDFNEQFTGIAEVYGAADVRKPFSEERKTPVDAIGAVRMHFGKVDLTLGGGAGLTRGQGSPDFRLFVGVTAPKAKRGIKEGPGVDLSQSRKTYALEDRDGDGRPSPGDVLQYQITLVNTGSEAAVEVQVDDPIPARTVYIPGTLLVNGRPASDAPGDDEGEYVESPAPTIVARIARLGTSPEDNHGEISFKVAIDKEITSPTPVVNQATAKAANVPEFPLPPAQTMVFPAIPQHEHVIVGPEKLELTEEIHFEFDKAVIRKESYPILKELAQVLKEYPDLRIRIEGNTDSVGSDEYNQKLSERRANAVRDFLVGLGIAKDRMQWVGRGESNPIASNDTAAGRAMNRRTEFIVLNPEAVKNAVLQPGRSNADAQTEHSEPAWLKKNQGTPPK